MIMDERIIEIKGTILEFILNINARIVDISDKYKVNREIEEERIANLLDDLQMLAEGIDVLKEYYRDISLPEFGEKLEMMTKALEEQDIPLFIDIIQYELKDLLEYWVECLNK